jgi:hypothetical protein
MQPSDDCAWFSTLGEAEFVDAFTVCNDVRSLVTLSFVGLAQGELFRATGTWRGHRARLPIFIAPRILKIRWISLMDSPGRRWCESTRAREKTGRARLIGLELRNDKEQNTQV